ncbi:MAG TPA: hypothetical protein ENJ87_06055 [Gammaproteobacteria bacterium]|nr:hypothetical protein [Gammaproteobacteria bacterium]
MNNLPEESTSIVKVIYILLIIGTMVGITSVIAVVMAYVNRDDTESWIQTHYRFQIRTFWIGALYVFIGTLTFQILVGAFILLFTFFWVVIRCAKGLKQLEKNRPVKNLESWLFT